MSLQPSVFAVGETYQILVPSPKPTLMWVRVGDHCFYDASNGVLRSKTKVHRMTVPMALLDDAKTYTICYRNIPRRLPYSSRPTAVREQTFSFIPVSQGEVRAYHISDAHNRIAEPIRAAQTFGTFDFLIFNGDMPNHSGDVKNFFGIFDIAFALTAGQKPIVFARGNHDLRGAYAEQYTDYIPHEGGCTYYPFRLGSIWGLVLDCAEDKDDAHEEYGHTVCCHDFRLRETAFLRQLTQEAPYLAPGIDRRVVIVHNPFTRRPQPPFDIEGTLYTQWAQLLREQIRPDLMLCGHLHTLDIFPVGGTQDHYGQPCPIVIGAKPGKAFFAGAGITFGKTSACVQFTDSDGNTTDTQTVHYGGTQV